MIVVATTDFEVYHGVVNELRDRDVAFTTVEPDEALPEGATVVVTGADEDVSVPDGVDVVRADPERPQRAVERALSILRGGPGRTVVGVDPGDRPGIVVRSGSTIVAAYHVPLADAVDVIEREVAAGIDPVVRIGDGARLKGATIVNALDAQGVRVEVVDETGTTPSLGTGARGMGDVLAAANIAGMEGEPVEAREIKPTEGELTTIQRRSRERSSENREIDAALARRVALGELTLDEALDEHREE